MVNSIDINKSLEELENHVWDDTDFPTKLVEKSFYARKKKLKDLETEDLRILVSQSIGLNFIVPIALELLNEDILVEGGFYEGDLLAAMFRIPPSFWGKDKNRELRKKLIQISSGLEDEIKKSQSLSDELKNDLIRSFLNFKRSY